MVLRLIHPWANPVRGAENPDGIVPPVVVAAMEAAKVVGVVGVGAQVQEWVERVESLPQNAWK